MNILEILLSVIVRVSFKLFGEKDEYNWINFSFLSDHFNMYYNNFYQIYSIFTIGPPCLYYHQILCLQERLSDFEDGDVHMSSHEHRFRMFSSVEYEGQLYMTPQNFIESVTMSEPRSTLFYVCLFLMHLTCFKVCYS